jgi:hypothetical protein
MRSESLDRTIRRTRLGSVIALVVTLTVVVVLAVAGRSWRDGQLSDRAVTNVVVGWAPAACAIYALSTGGSVAVAFAASALLALPGLLLYRTIFDLVREQGALRDRG